MEFNYNNLVDIPTDSSKNNEIIQKFNNILEKNNFNSTFKKKLDAINTQFKEEREPYDEIVNKIRWNTYYYKKYRQQTKMLFFIIFICILMIALSKLHSRYPYFDEKAYSLVIGIILGLAFIRVFLEIWDLYIRDNKNFDEYDYSVYGKPSGNITELNEKSNIDIKICNKPITPESINSSFLNKYV